MERIATLEERLAREGESASVLFELGKCHFELRDATVAIKSFERALVLDPESTEIKLAYADANIRKNEFEKIQLKGKLRRVTVYEVTGLKDPWSDPKVIPPRLAEKCRPTWSLIGVPEDLVLSVEGLDGSIGHSRCVALLSYATAEYLKLGDEMKKTILLAGFTQNLGKEAVPHHILNRAGRLSETEIKLLEKYIQESVATLRRLGYIDPQLLEIVLHHREMWNGSGYPDKLNGEAIPRGARITAVADAYSALTAWRPYRDAWDQRMAFSELQKGVEQGRYDPQVTQALAAMFRDYS